MSRQKTESIQEAGVWTQKNAGLGAGSDFPATQPCAVISENKLYGQLNLP